LIALFPPKDEKPSGKMQYQLEKFGGSEKLNDKALHLVLENTQVLS
jgi:hypothetical protein